MRSVLASYIIHHWSYIGLNTHRYIIQGLLRTLPTGLFTQKNTVLFIYLHNLQAGMILYT